MKYIIIAICTLGLFWSLAYSLLSSAMRENEKSKKEISSMLGKRIVLAKDTLTIIDYSRINETYTLSDGKEYAIDFVKNKVIK